jgi:asparagine synthase (glutamine-hydrolysing)
MCGIAGVVGLAGAAPPFLGEKLALMNRIQKHRGPDGDGAWISPGKQAGLGHVRLSVLDLAGGAQPMTDLDGALAITYNGEIYNFRELRSRLEGRHKFVTHSDTEVILKAYLEWGEDCVEHLRGMFAFAIWDGRERKLFMARDRFGIKPLYYIERGGVLYFASEIKAILPFLDEVRIDPNALRDYLTFQFCLQGKTLFQDVRELLPAHTATALGGAVSSRRYWQVQYNLDLDHTDKWFQTRLLELIHESVAAHIVSDVPVGAYVSGGMDSSALAVMARRLTNDQSFQVFHGKFAEGKNYDESPYARSVAEAEGMELFEAVIGVEDFKSSFDKIIHHMDFPAAGPGAFPQYAVSAMVKGKRKVVLGGQGGDEIFGGYVRYLIAYFEQCVKGAIEGGADPSRFIVTYESIIPNLGSLNGYQPLMKHFFSGGMFDPYDKRYYRLVDRSGDLREEVRWDAFPEYSPYQSFREIYFSNQIGGRCYFDSMLHFDFLTLLPALLQVEDRMSMAHGVESRTPFLDHPLVEFAATIPANVKFRGGELKRLLKIALTDILPPSILGRKDKMGFPVPLVDWLKTGLRGWVMERFASPSPSGGEFINYPAVLRGLETEAAFGRKMWGFMCLDSFFRQFVDGHKAFKP